MKNNRPLIQILVSLMIALAAFTLPGCETEQAAPEQSQASESDGEEISSEEAQAIVAEALAQDFTSVRFKMETKTTATAPVEGQSVTQTVKTNTTGELSRAEDDVWMHMNYTARSSDQPGKVHYEMYLADESMVLVQGEEMYNNPLTSEEMKTYVNSVVQVTNEDELQKMLDVARSCKLRSGDDGTKTMVITLDVDRIGETDIVDTSSLPEGSSISTMVVTYNFDESNRFSGVRLSSNTMGTPTYRVRQTYEFYDYDRAEKPEWPDFESYMLERTGLQKDEEGRFYFVDEDGTVFYVDSIDEDGTIHFLSPGAPVSSGGGESQSYYYYYGDTEAYGGTGLSEQQGEAVQDVADQGSASQSDDTDASGSGSSGGDAGTTDSSSDKGRAYIPLSDGTKIFLDEPGNQIIDVGGGSTALITPDGGFYFLSYGDEDE